MADKKIKICYLLPKFDLNTDTHFFYLYNFIKLAAEQADLSLVIEESKSDLSFFSGIKDIHVQQFSWAPLRFLENLALVIFMRLKGYNNFYTHYSYVSAFNSGLVARLTGAKAFYWNCGLAWNFGSDPALSLTLKAVHYLVTGVGSLKKGYADNYHISQDKIKIMPNWVDLERFDEADAGEIYGQYQLAKDKKYVLFTHRLSERKGAHYIAKTAQEFVSSQDVEFLVAGDGPYKAKLEQEIKEHNLSNIKLLGRVPNKKIPVLMKISQVFFMPSEEEGFPRVLLEAMAAGLPYVASDIGGVREISSAEQQNFIFAVGDLKGLVGGIKKLLDDSSARERLRKINAEHVKQFNIQTVVKIFVNNILGQYGNR